MDRREEQAQAEGYAAGQLKRLIRLAKALVKDGLDATMQGTDPIRVVVALPGGPVSVTINGVEFEVRGSGDLLATAHVNNPEQVIEAINNLY